MDYVDPKRPWLGVKQEPVAAAPKADACHLCGASLANALHVHDQARTGPLTTVACRHCTLLQTVPHPTAEEVTAYYASGEYRREFRDLPRYWLDENLEPEVVDGVAREVDPSAPLYPLTCQRHGEVAARRLVGLLGLTPEMLVVELGGGDGTVNAGLRRLGMKAWMVERDPDKAAQATKNGALCAIDGWETVQHDVAFALQVAEHFADPVCELAKMVELVKLGGIVYLEVPTVERPYGSLTHFLQKPHVVNYSQHTLAAAMRRAGLDDVRTGIEGQVLMAIGQRGESGVRPYEPHMGPPVEAVVHALHSWEKRRAETEKAVATLTKFERGELTPEEQRWCWAEFVRWRDTAMSLTEDVHQHVKALESEQRPDWHPVEWVRGFRAGRIYEGQRSGIIGGHILNKAMLRLNRKEAA